MMPTPVTVRLVLAVLTGVLVFLGFVGFGFYPLIFVAWVPLVVAVDGLSPRRAALVGLGAGTVANVGGYYWLVHVLTEFGDLAGPVAAVVLLAHAVYQGGMFALVMYAVRRADVDLGIAPPWTLPVAAVAAELIYPQLFPSNLGASLYSVSILTQVVDVTGVLGLTALVALVNGAVWELVRATRARAAPSALRLAVTAGIALMVVGYGLVRLPMVDAEIARAPRLQVALIQTNIGAREMMARREDFVARHREMSREALRRHPDLALVVWPESAFSRGLPRTAGNVARAVTGDLRVPVVFGAVTYEEHSGRVRIFNSAVLASARGDVLGRFDKTRLLAFGEALPLVSPSSGVAARMMRWLPRASFFTPGTTFEHLRVAGASMLVSICYEDILPGFVRESWRRAGPPDVLLNLTNDSWFGDTHEPRIHLALASLRAIETRRALIRSTNTGISALVDPAGRIYARTEQWAPAILAGGVPLITSGARPLYQRVGDVLGWLCLATVAVGWIASWRRRRAAPLASPPADDRRGRRSMRRLPRQARRADHDQAE